MLFKRIKHKTSVLFKSVNPSPVNQHLKNRSIPCVLCLNNRLYTGLFEFFPGGKPLQNSKTGVFIENPIKLQPDEPRVSSLFVNTGSGFNGGINYEAETGPMGKDRTAQPVAPESDVSAPAPAVEGESSPALNAQPTRRTRSRIKPPIIEVIYVPTKFDPDDKKVVYDILAEWILNDIEKEIKGGKKHYPLGKG